MRIPGTALSALCVLGLMLGAMVPLSAASLSRVTLRDQEDHVITLPDGRVWAVTFIFTSCRGACPALMQNITWVERELSPKFKGKVQFSAITFDPDMDTPAALKAYGVAHHFDGRAKHLLTGSPAALRQIYDAFKFDYKPDASEGYQHVNLLAIMDQHGNIVQRFYGMKPDMAHVEKTIGKLLE